MPSTARVAVQSDASDRVTTLTIDQLRLSPLNVRTHEAAVNADAIARMEASLLANGQLEPILCHLLRGSTRHYGCHAGGRRYRAFKNLVADGRLRADQPIRVVIRETMSDGELVLESSVENMERKDLEPYETFAAVRRAYRLGMSVDQISAAFAQDADRTKRMLRLGELAEPIFTALKEARITEDQARAFGATGDQAVQLAAWETLQAAGGVPRSAERIRAALGLGDRELDTLLAFVGEAPYLAAGGRLEPDLFAAGDGVVDGFSGRIVDPDKLRALADAALDVLRADVRRRTARPDLRFQPHPPRGQHDGADWQLHVTPKVDEMGTVTLPDGDVVARVFVDAGGRAQVDYWWASRSAKYANQKGERAASAVTPRAADAAIGAAALQPGAAIGQQYDNARQVADAALKEEEGLTADTVEILRSQRRMILRAMIVEQVRRDEGQHGLLFLVWSQLRLALDVDARPSQFGAAKLPSLPAPAGAFDHINAMPGHAVWRDALAELARESFVTCPDLRAAFADFLAAPLEVQRLAAAVVAGLSLERSLGASGYEVAVHDELGRALGVGSDGPRCDEGWGGDAAIRRYWTPTPELIGKLPARHRLAIAEPFVAPDRWSSWTRLNAAEVTRHVMRLLRGEQVPGVDAAAADRAARWVPQFLRFAPADPVDAEPDDPAPDDHDDEVHGPDDPDPDVNDARAPADTAA